jgi:hypothetical protein
MLSSGGVGRKRIVTSKGNKRGSDFWGGRKGALKALGKEELLVGEF